MAILIVTSIICFIHIMLLLKITIKTHKLIFVSFFLLNNLIKNDIYKIIYKYKNIL